MNNNNHQNSNGTSGMRRLTLLVAGMGLSALAAYLISRLRGGAKGASVLRSFPENAVDDRGTGQTEAAQILRNLRDRGFESSDEKLAIALGRPLEEVAAWNAGQELIDDDVVMKARGIALHRGVHVE